MKVFLTIVTTLMLALSLSAGVLEGLKEKPASKYDLGKFKLELMAYILTTNYKDKEVGDTGFDTKKFYIKINDNKLYFTVTTVGRAKDMNEETCNKISHRLAEVLNLEKLIKDVWENLSDAEYQQLTTEVQIATELVSKENSNFVINCQRPK